MRNVWDVGSRQFAVPPSWRLPGCFGIAVENRIWPLHTANVGTRELLGSGILAVYWPLEMSERRGTETRHYPAEVCPIGNAPSLWHEFFPRRRCEPWQEPTLTLIPHQRLQWRPPIRWDDVQHGLAVLRHEGVQIDDMGDPLRRLIGNTGNDHPT